MSSTPPSALPSSVPPPSFRGRISSHTRGGHYAAPHRYALHLCLSCPSCLRIAVTHSLLGLDEVLPVVLLPAVPDEPGGGHSALRRWYEASAHRYAGGAVAPLLGDEWTGRIVSTHAPHIVRDLARHFSALGHGGAVLHPCGREAEIEAVGRLCEEGVNDAAQRAGQPGACGPARDGDLDVLFTALDRLEGMLGGRPYLLGEEITAADVELWVTLVRLDTAHRWHLDAAAVDRIAGHPQLWAYARRLAAHPAFGPHLDLHAIARRHHAQCNGLEAAGAAMHILDWAQALPDRFTAQPG
ncbi:glutathione S-transferase C-terminal domain-containing protein [Streptomyces sp. V4-01]|uniref:Glutathione S-transferase C-terminal domain-containing protein n=1 Tax=Actinacidiphila polyblastidii TaxID=3110430 RepID=A0ABU7P424_9ACTN|nr:glutathione S-transferase C-terminal domain-containing protein [Streptomyces sp. V4-01]